MNLFNQSKNDRYNRGLLARPSARYTNPASAGVQFQPGLLNGNHYVSSEAAEAAALHEYGYHNQPMYEADYPFHSSNDRFPIDERTEDLKHRIHHHRSPQTRRPGYVTSIDTTPSQPLPHSSLSSFGDPNDLIYSEYGQYASADGYTRRSPYMLGVPHDELYSAGDWSSDGSSEASQGRGYQARSRHRPHVGQRRMTDLGREVFNGVAWIAEEDYLHDTAHMPQPMPGQSPYHGRIF